MADISKKTVDVLLKFLCIKDDRLWWVDDAPVSAKRKSQPIDKGILRINVDGVTHKSLFTRAAQIVRDGAPMSFYPYFIDGNGENRRVSNVSASPRCEPKRAAIRSDRIQTAAIPIDLLMQCIEISGDHLVWKDFYGLSKHRGYKKDRYRPGELVGITWGGKDGESPYIRINIRGKPYQSAYGRAAFAVKTGKWPDGKIWFIDGDKKNIKISNLSDKPVLWWAREGLDCPLAGFR